MFDIKTERRWKVSAAWLTKRFNCTLEHILDPDGCGGRCCRNPSLWPPRAYPGSVCGHLSKTGCSLSMEQRPITCILFPIIPSKTSPLDPDNNTLIIYQRAIFPHSMCKGAYKKGPMVIDMCAKELTMIFGKEEYERVRSDLIAGKDSYFVISDEVLAEFQRDVDQDDYENSIFTPPEPRNYIKGRDNE